jgi:hypothetical protein
MAHAVVPRIYFGLGNVELELCIPVNWQNSIIENPLTRF